MYRLTFARILTHAIQDTSNTPRNDAASCSNRDEYADIVGIGKIDVPLSTA